MVCANATCCHKLSLMLIGKYIRPACFANQTCSLKYAAQKCAWMDIPTCWNWFNEVIYPVVRWRICHPVLLLMNNNPGCFEAFQRENVMVRYFTPNVQAGNSHAITESLQLSKRDINSCF